jgi:SAM-dependent methyltransferase
MHEILRLLPSDARVLDLGCASGSFPEDQCPATIVRYDLDCHPTEKGSAAFVCGDARTLPFRDRSFNAAILNHSLEHFSDPGIALSEIKRVLDEPAYLYVAVPDASTITDRLYRWLARGGGHVNQFTDADSLVRLIEEKTNLSHVGTRLLFTSFSFMNRTNCRTRPPRRLYLLGGGAEWVLRLATIILRKTDKLMGTRARFTVGHSASGPRLPSIHGPGAIRVCAAAPVTRRIVWSGANKYVAACLGLAPASFAVLPAERKTTSLKTKRSSRCASGPPYCKHLRHYTKSL